MRFNIAVADADGVDICKRTQELIHVELDLQHGHRLLELHVVTRSAVDSLWDVFENEVEVNLVFLENNGCIFESRARTGRERSGSTLSPFE